MKIVETVCLGMVTACLCILLLEGALTLREMRRKTDEALGQVEGLVNPAQKALAGIAAASLTVAQIGAKERNDFDAQQNYYRQLSRDTDALLESANLTIKGINENVIPRLSTNLDLLSDSTRIAGDRISSVAGALDGTIESAKPLLVSITADTDALHPAIQNIAGMTAHGVAISASLEDISARVDKAVGKALAPKNRFLAGLNSLANGAITVSEFIYYVTH